MKKQTTNKMKKQTETKTMLRKGPKKFITLKNLLLVLVAVLLTIGIFGGPKVKYENVSYSELVAMADTFESMDILTQSGNTVMVVKAYTSEGGFVANVLDSQLEALYGAIAPDATITTMSQTSVAAKTAITWLAIVIIVAIVLYGISKIILNTLSFLGGAAGGAGAPKNEMTKTRMEEMNTDVKLADVAGIEEEKFEVMEIVDMLKNTSKYAKAGVKIPKGVLLEGRPGTGKSLLAKAMANEADCKFFSVNGSDFVEMYVGVGAARIRDTFEEAKKHTPCIIFFDEIDGIAAKRDSGGGRGNEERESTLNALLTQMDGVSSDSGIIVIAATNRSNMLDAAIMRPGRFDRKIELPVPDTDGRAAILAVHAKNKTLADGVTFHDVSKRCSGFTGAELANVMNEAAILMVRENTPHISLAQIDEAIDRTMMGPAKKSIKMDAKTRELVAYHEAGHAVAGLVLEDGVEVVQKITIIPRRDALGYVMSTPEQDKHLSTEVDLLNRIKGLLAGRIMEEIKFGTVTTGASNDFMKATSIASSMVLEYGMSNLGVVQLRTTERTHLEGYSKDANMSEETRIKVDAEINRIIGECYDEMRMVLEANMDKVNLIANAVLEFETITKEEIEALMAQGQAWVDSKIATRNHQVGSTGHTGGIRLAAMNKSE